MLFLAIVGAVYLFLTVVLIIIFFAKIELSMEGKTTNPIEDLKRLWEYLAVKTKLYLLNRRITRIERFNKMKAEIKKKTKELEKLENPQSNAPSSKE